MYVYAVIAGQSDTCAGILRDCHLQFIWVEDLLRLSFQTQNPDTEIKQA